MYNTPNLVLISLLLVIAIIAVGSLLFINTRPEASPSVNLESPLTVPVTVPVTEPTPDPTPNNQVFFLPTTHPLLAYHFCKFFFIFAILRPYFGLARNAPNCYHFYHLKAI